jgi:hypothetical protein
MLIHCTKCREKIEKHQCYEYQANLFCGDCYMDILSPPKAFDPWAVHSAQTFLKGKDKVSTLTPLQLKIVGYIRGKVEATIEEIMENLNLDEEVFKREFAVLRHMEILKANKKGDEIFYTLF